MSDIDILSLDNKIKQLFVVELRNLPKYEKTLKSLTSVPSKFARPKLLSDYQNDIKILNLVIEDVYSFYFYQMKTFKLLNEYSDMINTSVLSAEDNKDTLSKLTEKYFEIVKSCFSTKILKKLCLTDNYGKQELINSAQLTCTNCQNTKDFINQDDNLYICIYCYAEILTLSVSTTNDTSRINISNKYVYDKKSRFKDCLNQYQAKQNVNISQDVYDNIEAQLVSNGTIVPKGELPHLARFKKITRYHVLYFLKELGYTKHYEDVILIHFILTGQPPDNIEHLEGALMEDFTLLLDTYNVLYKNISKKRNFINVQYVLFHLLKKHGYPCKKEDFAVLKTIERKSNHDDICKTLFDELGWDFNEN